MLPQGLYEKLINNLLQEKLDQLDQEEYYIQQTTLDKAEAARYLGTYLQHLITSTLVQVKGEDALQQQLEITNKIIKTLAAELPHLDLSPDLLHNHGLLLSAIFKKENAEFSNLQQYLKSISPVSGLVQSKLFTGGHADISLDGELKKEINSADEINILVSFIKWSGIRIFEREFKQFTSQGKRLRIITTSYMGATDTKAIQFLANLPNTEVKVSYNTQSERLHAKAFLFLRKTKFDTAYIGSSNISHSALTKGLEWNIKVTTQEIAHIIQKFRSTFESYWEDAEFEYYNPETDEGKLNIALKEQKIGYKNKFSTFFDIRPWSYQKEILEQLQAQRKVHHRFRNLVVAATGTGKTMIAAFDYLQYSKKNPNAKLLFVAHRKEILEQAQHTFQAVLKDNNFGALWVANYKPDSYTHLFASVQTLRNQLPNLQLSQDFYDMIIVDEVHHISASSYRPILEKFKPTILLGLTATPERMDGADILSDFDNTIAAEIRLPQALNRKLLCPFQYFGISDNISLENITWKNGRYVPSELSRIYTQSDQRVRDVITALRKYLTDEHDVRALCYCVNKDHAQFMAEKFSLNNFKADYLTSDKSKDRDQIRLALQNKTINYLFVVDMFNEGIDIPEIDTVLFLRPTDSLTVFLQQLGRGLRLDDSKECLTVLDFVGNARPEYDFASKFRAITGKSQISIGEEVERDFPKLPLGCSIVLEKKAKEYILKNIYQATNFNINKLIARIQNFKHETNLSLSLNNFIKFTGISIQKIYSKGSWTQLCSKANNDSTKSDVNEKEFYRALSKKWLSIQSATYLKFILKLIDTNFDLDQFTSSVEQKMALMFHYDVWHPNKSKGVFKTLQESVDQIAENLNHIQEVVEFLQYRIEQINFLENPLATITDFPLQLHARYTRDQILVAMGLHKFNKPSSNREGVAENKIEKIEALFVTLKKSEKYFSPTTMYHDYAINDRLFHWQSQNSAGPDTPKGKSYINHQIIGKRIILFVRESEKDEHNITMGFVNLGEVIYQKHSGAKPMNVTWRLNDPLPAFLWEATAKLAVG